MLKNPTWSFAVLAFAIAASGALQAQPTQTVDVPVSASCSGGGQLCDNIAEVQVDSQGVLEVLFIGGQGLCSNIRQHLLVDGNEVTVTGFVGAGQSTAVFNLGPVSPGGHTLGLQAEGQVGGCNSGTLAAWSGTARITTSQSVIGAQAEVPTLAEWAIALLAAVLAISGTLIARRRTR